MADEPHVETDEIEAQPSDGNRWKWLAAAAVAAIVAIGGYFALTNYGPSQSSADIASNEASFDENGAPVHAGPLAASSGAGDLDDSARASPAAVEARSAPPAQRRTASARANDVPEQVVGVIPASATIDESDDIIVEGARRPVWASTPNVRRLSSVYPSRALERGREGEARVSCFVQESGALDCERVAEYPANSGFGNAALRVARMYRHAPERWDGSSAVGSPVNLRVVFRIEDEDRRRG